MNTLRLANDTVPAVRAFDWARPAVLVPALMAFVTLLSVFVLSRESLRLDESQSLWQTSHSSLRILYIVGQDVHVPFYHLVLHYWQLLFGNGVPAARFLSLVFFVASIPLLYRLGLRAFESREAALFAAALFALSPFMNWYGNEIRMYSLFVFLTILSHYFFIGIYKRRDRLSFVGYAVTAVFGIFTHYFFFIVLAVQFFFYLARRELFPPGTFARFAITGGVLAAAFLPWAVYVWQLGFAGNSQPLLPVPTSVNVFNALAEFFIGFQEDHVNSIIISTWPLLVLVSFLMLRKHNRLSPEAIYFFFAALAPIIAIYALSVLVKPIYVSRYLIFTAPALFLALSSVIYSYVRPASLVFRGLLIALMVTTLGLELWNPEAPVKEDYRAAATYLSAEAEANDVIILSAPFTIYPVEYYYRGPASIRTIPDWDRTVVGAIPPFDEAALPEEAARLTEGYRRVFVLLSYDQGYEDEVKRYFETHYQMLSERVFSPKLTLYEFQLRYDDVASLSVALPQGARE